VSEIFKQRLLRAGAFTCTEILVAKMSLLHFTGAMRIHSSFCVTSRVEMTPVPYSSDSTV